MTASALAFAIINGAALALFSVWAVLPALRAHEAISAPALARRLREAERFWSDSSWHVVFPLVRLLARLNAHHSGSQRGKEVERLLRVLGNPLRLKYPDFLAICQLCAAAGFVVGLLMGAVLIALVGAPVWVMTGFAFLATLTGLFVPWYYLHGDAAEKVRFIRKDLPYVLDLLLLLMRAGATMQEAFEVVASEGTYGELGEELALVSREVHSGTVLSQALLNLVDRIPEDDLAILVQAVNQGMTMGTPMVDILRDQADLIRQKRSQRAEQLAKKAEVKMSGPVMLILVATFILILGPAVIEFSSNSLK